MKRIRIVLAGVVLAMGLLPFVASPAHADPIPCGQKIVIRNVYVGQVPCIFDGG